MDSLKTAPIITGLWQIADMERDGKQTDQAAMAQEMKKLIEAGLDTFDMTDWY